MQNTIKILIDFKKEIYRFDKAQQGDDVILDITLLENGVAKDLKGEKIELIYINANNTVASVAGNSVVINGNNVKITCPRDCTRSYGIAKFQLKMTNTYQVSTFPIALTIVPGVDQGQQISQNISTILEQLTAKNIECNETLESLNAWVSTHGDIVAIDTRLTTAESKITENTLQYTCGALKNTKSKLKAKKPLRIVCHGDSMTWGYNDGAIQSVNNYPSVLQTKMRYIYEYNDITVINEGHSGQTSAYGLLNFDTQVLNYNPDLLIIMWGLNDSYNNNVTLADFIENIRQMIILAKKNNIEIIIATPVPIISRSLGLMYDLENKNYVDVLKLLTTEQGVTLCDVYEEFITMFSRNIVGKDSDYDNSGHLKDYSIVADYIMADKLCDIYSPKHSDGDIIRFDTNQVFNSVTTSSTNSSAMFSERYYVVDSNKPNEKIKIVLYANAKIKLDIIAWIYTTGGNIDVKNYGNTLIKLNSYSTIPNINKVLSMELNKGLYCIELSGANVESSKSFTVSSIVYNVVKPSTFQYYNLALQNSWETNGSGFAEPIYTKTNNMVRLSGLIKNGATTTDTVISNLPVGYRPSKDLVIPVISFEGSTAYAGYLRIKPSGDIVCYVNIHNGFLPLEFSFLII